MDENQLPQQQSQESEPTQPLESKINEPQLQMQPPAPKKSRAPLLIVLLLVLLFAVGGVATYFMTQDDEPTPVDTSQTSQETNNESEEPAEESKTNYTYQSKLYPDLSFTVPEGWEVTEPETYDDNGFGEGSVNGTITVTNGDAVLKLDLVTVLATGFEGYSCYNYDSLTAVGDVYRYEDTEMKVVYAGGISESDDEWAEVIADEGNFTSFEDPDPNYCVSFPFIGTYSSTLNQVDYPDQPYGFADQEKAIVWLSAVVEGTPTADQLLDTDTLIRSLSKPDLGV